MGDNHLHKREGLEGIYDKEVKQGGTVSEGFKRRTKTRNQLSWPSQC